MSPSKWFGILTVFALAGSAVSLAAPEDLKIGVVDMQEALRTVEAGKKAKSDLESAFNKKKTELQKDEADIKKLHEELQKQSLVLSDQARAKKQGELQQKVIQLQEKTAKSQMEIQKKEQELTSPIIEKLRGIISQLAKDKGYTYILEKNENNVLYSPEKDDLTKDVVEAYNKKNKG